MEQFLPGDGLAGNTKWVYIYDTKRYTMCEYILSGFVWLSLSCEFDGINVLAARDGTFAFEIRQYKGKLCHIKMPLKISGDSWSGKTIKYLLEDHEL